MSPLAIGAIVLGIASTGAALGFMGCAIFSSKSIADWRDRLIRLGNRAKANGMTLPEYAIVEETEFMAYMRNPRVKRGRPIVPAIITAILTAGIAGITIFFCRATATGPKEALGFAALCAAFSGAGAWALWAGWPMRRPRVGRAFVEKWADRNPVEFSEKNREKYVRDILEAVDVDIDKEGPK